MLEARWDGTKRNLRNNALHQDMLTDGVRKEYTIEGKKYLVLFDKTFVLARIADLIEQLNVPEQEFIALVTEAYPLAAEKKDSKLHKLLRDTGLTKEDLKNYID